MSASDITAAERIADALRDALVREHNSHVGEANVIDGLFAIARAIHVLAEAIRDKADA